jgi:ferrochelatase
MSYDALLVVSFGGPEKPDDVMPFLENVTRGRNVPRARLEQVARHYGQFGGKSPINDQTRALIAALEQDFAGAGLELPIYWGNRNWHPLLERTVRQMADDGVRRALAFVTSAYSSYSSCRQYLENIDHARTAVGAAAPVIDKIRPYWNHPGFIDAIVAHTRDASAQVPATVDGASVRVVFTAHSIPLAMATACDYEAQLRDAAALVSARFAPPLRWDLAFQSRSGPPAVPWLEPDIVDHLATIVRGGVRHVIVVPLGFVSDHMEVVYDLDTETAAAARELGVGFTRARTPGTAPQFIAMIRELVMERMDDRPPRSLGDLGPRAVPCPPGCCAPVPRPPG